MYSIVAKNLSSWTGIVLSCLLLASCFETEQEFTLNPDGSGKMALDATFPNISLNGNQKLDEKALKDVVTDFFEKAEGIEAWRDVSYEWTDDGRVHFKGTGYFADISKIDLNNISMMDFKWETEGGNGSLSMEMRDDNDEDESVAEASKDPKERAEQIKAERAKFQQMKPMMSGMLSGMKHSAVFHLPGKAGETVNFTPDASGKVAIEITGEKMIAAMETLVNDDKWMAENSFNPQEGPKDDEELSKAIFGNKKPPMAKRVAVGAPLFDYARELAMAHVEFAKLQEELGPKIAPPANGKPFESLEIVGVQSVSEVEQELNFRPFNSDAGYSLSLLGKFSGSVLDMTDNSKLEKAIASDGSDLLPKRDFDRKINFPRLSEDRSAVLFEVDLISPGKGVESIREISGTVQYTVSSGTKEVDLGFTALKVGETGKALEAKLKNIKDGWKKDGTKDIEIELDVEKETLKELIMVEGAKRTVMNRRGFSRFGQGPATFTFESKNGVPENAELIAVLHDGVETYDIPFKLENISLLGEFLGE